MALGWTVKEVRALMVPILSCFLVGNGIVFGGLRDRSHGCIMVSLVTRRAFSVNTMVSAAMMA